MHLAAALGNREIDPTYEPFAEGFTHTLTCDYQLPFQDYGRVGKIAVEEIYCLYVAVTRARSLLIIPDQLSKAVLLEAWWRAAPAPPRARPNDLTAVVHDLTTDESPLQSASVWITSTVAVFFILDGFVSL